VVIVGGWAHRLLRYHPLAQAVPHDPLLTLDADIAIPVTLDTDVAIPATLEGSEQDLRGRLKSCGFEEKFLGENQPPATHFERTVNRDNTVSFQNLSLQIERVRWRASLAGCQAVVHQHLDGTLSLTHGPHCLGRYTAQGTALATTEMPEMPARRAVEKTRAGKVIKPTFPPRLEIPQTPRDSHFPTAPTAAG
jgi:hypothetical protein